MPPLMLLLVSLLRPLKSRARVALLAAAAVLPSSALRAAKVEDWLARGLLHPGLISAVQEELALTDEQQARLKEQLETARQQAEPLEQAVKQQQQALGRLLEDPAADADAATAQLGRLIEAEKAVKELQLRTLISLRDVLTPEQLTKAKKLRPRQMPAAQAAGAATEQGVMAKVERLRVGAESAGVPLTEAMKARGQEIEGMIQAKDFQAADAALDRLMADSHVNELEAEPEAVDFSKFEPGSTDVDTLKQRYEDVKTAAQEVVSLPLLRDLLQAKEAFEQAKEAQDAEQVGRILTYVEGKLKKP